MTIDFPSQSNNEIIRLEDESKRLAQQADALQATADALRRVRETRPLPLIVAGNWPEAQWRVWVPPFLESHFEGDEMRAPFGDSYWQSLEGAAQFMADSLAAIERGEHGSVTPT